MINFVIVGTKYCLRYETATTNGADSNDTVAKVEVSFIDFNGVYDSYGHLVFVLDAEKIKGDKKTICKNVYSSTACVQSVKIRQYIRTKISFDDPHLWDQWGIKRLQLQNDVGSTHYTAYGLDSKSEMFWVGGGKEGNHDGLPHCANYKRYPLKSCKLVVVGGNRN